MKYIFVYRPALEFEKLWKRTYISVLIFFSMKLKRVFPWKVLTGLQELNFMDAESKLDTQNIQLKSCLHHLMPEWEHLQRDKKQLLLLRISHFRDNESCGKIQIATFYNTPLVQKKKFHSTLINFISKPLIAIISCQTYSDS